MSVTSKDPMMSIPTVRSFGQNLYSYDSPIKTSGKDFFYDDSEMKYSLEIKAPIDAGEKYLFILAKSVKIYEEATLKGRNMVIIADTFDCLGTLDFEGAIFARNNGSTKYFASSWKEHWYHSCTFEKFKNDHPNKNLLEAARTFIVQIEKSRNTKLE